MLIHVEEMSLKNIKSVLCKRIFLCKEHSQSTKNRMLRSVTCFTATLNSKQESWVLGRATSIFFNSPETKMLVASGDRVPLGYSLGSPLTLYVGFLSPPKLKCWTIISYYNTVLRLLFILIERTVLWYHKECQYCHCSVHY